MRDAAIDRAAVVFFGDLTWTRREKLRAIDIRESKLNVTLPLGLILFVNYTFRQCPEISPEPAR